MSFFTIFLIPLPFVHLVHHLWSMGSLSFASFLSLVDDLYFLRRFCTTLTCPFYLPITNRFPSSHFRGGGFKPILDEIFSPLPKLDSPVPLTRSIVSGGLSVQFLCIFLALENTLMIKSLAIQDENLQAVFVINNFSYIKSKLERWLQNFQSQCFKPFFSGIDRLVFCNLFSLGSALRLWTS